MYKQNMDKINEIKKVTDSDRYIDLSGFKMRETLNPKVWDKDQKLKPEVRKALLKIANDYFDGLELPGVDIEDVTFTGSLANYNWSQYSDVDLHIIIDYKEVPVDPTLVQDFLKTKSSAWNDSHDIKIYGFDVELYVQDVSEEHVSSGVYSILNNEWLVKPEKKRIKVDDVNVRLKSERIMDTIDNLYDEMKKEKDYESVVVKVDKLKDRIKKMRQTGLDDAGEFSVENMVFKVLRRNGMMERLYDIKIFAYDKMMSLHEQTNKVTNIKEEIENDLSWLNDYLGQEDPLEQVKEFIYNKLKDCELLPSQKSPGSTKYVDKNGDILFAEELDNGTNMPWLYVDYHKIWEKCEEMGCSWEDFEKICKDMLYEVHKRKVHTAIYLIW